MSRRKKEDAKENQGIDVKEQKGNPSRRKKTRMQEEKRKDVKDKLWKDVEEKKKKISRINYGKMLRRRKKTSLTFFSSANI